MLHIVLHRRTALKTTSLINKNSKAVNSVQQCKASTTKENHDQTGLHLDEVLNCVPRTQ